jgi:hypothetical protein
MTAAVPDPHNSAKSHKPQSTQRPHQGLLGYQELDYLCEAFVIFVLYMAKIRYLQSNQTTEAHRNRWLFSAAPDPHN